MDYTISNIIDKAGSFSEKDAALLKEELQLRTLKKGAILLEKGCVCSSVAYVVSGCLYLYDYDTDLEKNVIDLYTSNDWVLNHKSFTTRKPSEYVIEAFEDCTIYEISMDAIHKLIAISQSFLQMGKILDEANTRISFFDNKSTPDEKYEFIVNNKPDLIQKFPQKMIASYLKITPETLSRVRKRFLNN